MIFIIRKNSKYFIEFVDNNLKIYGEKIRRKDYSQAFLAAMVASVSPSCEKTVLNKFNSSEDLSLEITQAIEVIKLTNSQEFKINTSIYNMKKRFS